MKTTINGHSHTLVARTAKSLPNRNSPSNPKSEKKEDYVKTTPNLNRNYFLPKTGLAEIPIAIAHNTTSIKEAGRKIASKAEPAM